MQRIKGIFKASREREDEFALLGKKNILALGAGFLTATVKLVETCQSSGSSSLECRILSSQCPSVEKVRTIAFHLGL